MIVKHCTERDVDEIYEKNALAFEGTADDSENLLWLVNWLKANDCELLSNTFYIITGRVMNNKYHLSGRNAFKDNLNILCVKFDDLSSVANIAIPKIDMGGCWFSDIVDNHTKRE